MTVLELDKDSIPYSVTLSIDDIEFELVFRYHLSVDRVYVDLYKDDVLIQANEMIQYGIPLWHNTMSDIEGNLDDNYPNCWIIPLSIDGRYRECSYKNLGDSVVLTIQNRYDVNEEVNVMLYQEGEK